MNFLKKFSALLPDVRFDTESAVVYPVFSCTMFDEWQTYLNI